MNLTYESCVYMWSSEMLSRLYICKWLLPFALYENIVWFRIHHIAFLNIFSGYINGHHKTRVNIVAISFFQTRTLFSHRLLYLFAVKINCFRTKCYSFLFKTKFRRSDTIALTKEYPVPDINCRSKYFEEGVGAASKVFHYSVWKWRGCS